MSRGSSPILPSHQKKTARGMLCRVISLLSAQSRRNSGYWGGHLGPMPETSVPVWYTEMASVCAGEKPSTPVTAALRVITTAPEDRKRLDLTTTTMTKDFIHTRVNCLDVGLIYCPVNWQNTSQSTEKRTIVTVVPSGQKNIAFIMDTVPSPIAFRHAETFLQPLDHRRLGCRLPQR